MKEYWAVIGTKGGQETICGAYESDEDAKVRWYDVCHRLGYEETSIRLITEDEISNFKKTELRFLHTQLF